MTTVEAVPDYSVATLVTDFAQHEEMRRSFVRAGFSAPGTEFIFIDNSGPSQTSAYAGLNRMLNEARGRYVILCHQDVRLDFDERAKLDSCLADLECRDPDWALAGNAGGVSAGRLAIRISDPHGIDRHLGVLPARVQSLDENFIVVKREARIGFSRNLDGFHLYGADICLAAEIMGYSSYVIDFHLRHLSPGRKSADFHASARAFSSKWSNVLRPRWLQTTCTLIHINSGRIGGGLGWLMGGLVEKFSRRLPGAAGWRVHGRRSS
ncbi:MAG: hypothetical protein RLZ98_3698 [Pseudomonadota bacterium]|jgi:hypothetical protein